MNRAGANLDPVLARRTHSLDGLRGILAVAVCLYHGPWVLHLANIDQLSRDPVQTFPQLSPLLTKLYLNLLNGDFAVTVFFIMSGAVLFHSLERNWAGNFFAELWRFSLKRLLRIYPTVLSTLALFTAAFYSLQSVYPDYFKVYFSWSQLLETAILWRISMYGVAWTLQVEIVMVPLIVVGYFLYRRWAEAGSWLLIVTALFIYKNPFFQPLSVVADNFLPFALGFLVFTPFGKSLGTAVERTGLFWLTPLFLARFFFPYGDWHGDILYCFIGFLLVAGVAHSKPERPSFLESRPLQYVGRVSFSFYLLNPIFLEFFARYFRGLFQFPDSQALLWGIVVGTVSVLATLMISGLSYRFIERPFMALGNRV